MPFKTYQITDNLNKYNKYAGDYRAGKISCSDYFNTNTSPEEIIAFSNNLNWQGDRANLVGILTEYLTRLDASKESLNNAISLKNEDTFAIVAGHQPSLCGGPLFIPLKIASTISICRKLNQLGEKRFVPVFWNASEDHHTSEFNKVNVFDNNHDIYNGKLPLVKHDLMASTIPAEITAPLIFEFASILPQTEFHQEVFDLLQTSMQGSLGEMFSRILLEWFKDDGLIVLEPYLVRPLASNVFKNAAKRTLELDRAKTKDSEEMLSLGYKPPLPYNEPEKTQLFYIDGGKRIRILKDEDSFNAECFEKALTEPELLELIDNDPSKFSQTAALRPVVQSTVLPVAAYVPGAGELAYHFQLRSIFKELNVKMPPLVPRITGTILKPAITKALTKKYSLSPTEILSSDWSWLRIEKNLSSGLCEIDNAFSEFNADLATSCSAFTYSLKKAGITNLNEWEREKHNFTARLEGLKKRLQSQNPLLGKEGKSQFFKLRKYILPGENYQELSCWFIYFYLLHGQEILDTIKEVEFPFNAEHYLFVAEKANKNNDIT